MQPIPALCRTKARMRVVGAGFSRSRAAKRHWSGNGACVARDRLKPAPTTDHRHFRYRESRLISRPTDSRTA